MHKNDLILLAIKNEDFKIKKLIGNKSDIFFAKSKDKVFELLAEHNFDLVIFDLEIEDTDAIEICKEIRLAENLHQPFIIVIGDRPEDYVHSLVLDAGADDYILKPLKLPLAMARIEALMRRKIKIGEKSTDIQSGLIINLEEHLVYIHSKKIELPKKEFDILNLLYSNPKKTFSRAEITNLIWGNDLENKDHNIDTLISKIRKELGKEVIKTIKGVGYTLA